MKNKLIGFIAAILVLSGIHFYTTNAVTVLFPEEGGTGVGQVPEKGTLLVGSSTGIYQLLSSSTNGLVLKTSSTALLGIEWSTDLSGSGGLSTSTPFTEGLLAVVLDGNTVRGYTLISYNSSTGVLSIPTTTFSGIIDGNLDRITTGTTELAVGVSGTIPVFFTNGDYPYFYIMATSSPPSNGNGCFRINSGSGGEIPGAIHVGSECTQGWTDSYIDVNDVNQNNELERRLMQFWYTNAGGGKGIGASININTRSFGSQTLNLILTTSASGTNGVSDIMRNVRLDNNLSVSSSSIEDFRVIDLGVTNSIGDSVVDGPAIVRATGVFSPQFATAQGRVSSSAAFVQGRFALASQQASSMIGLYAPTQAAGGKVRWSVLAGEDIQFQTGKRLVLESPQTLLTNNYDTVTAYGDTFLNYANSGLNIEVDLASSSLHTSTTSQFKLALLASSTLTVQASTTLRNHLDFQQTTAPTLSSCGTTPIIETGSTDHAGRFYVGTGVVSSCLMTFNVGFTTSTACSGNDESQILLVRSVAGAASVTFDVATTFGGDKISYQCSGIRL